MPKTPTIVSHSRSRLYFFRFVLVLAVLLSGVLAYQYLWGTAASNIVALQEENRLYIEKIDALGKERKLLNEKLAAAERSSQIDREAAKLVRAELKTFQDERLKLEQELTFLRGIVSNGVKQEGIQIQGFRLETVSETEREYRYRFTVSKGLKDTGHATGWISVALDGMLLGEPKTLLMKEVTEDETEKLKMRFRHFQDVEGVVQLPEGFDPQHFVLKITPTTKKLSPVSKRLTWRITG